MDKPKIIPLLSSDGTPLDALPASGGTLFPTMIAAPAKDRLGQQLGTVAEILSGLACLPLEVSLVMADPGGTANATQIGDTLSVGRSSTCGLICRTDTGLSKKHFEVFRQNNHYFLRDLSSKNGTRKNDELCPPDAGLQLIDGDVISAGGCTFVFLAGTKPS